MTDILVVEDNRELGGLLCDFLGAEGYSRKHCESGEKAVEFFEKEGARLVVLDVVLPKMDGFAVCRKIRETSNAPIIIISAKTEKDDKINGLVLGADDYIEKPYDIDILLAKISGIFKRRYENFIIEDGGIRLDKNSRNVVVDGKTVDLTAKEYELLLLLMENKGKTLKKEYIFNKIWGFDSFSEPQTLTVHVKWLRQKLGKPDRIQTVWGVGYRFE